MFPLKLLLGKDMFTLKLVDLEYETRVSIWEFEKLIVSEMTLLPSFRFATRLSSQNTIQIEFINEL